MFKCWLEVTVLVNGKEQSCKTTIKVDPSDIFIKSMSEQTHFWKTFVARTKNYFVVISNKSNGDDDFPLHPDQF